MPKKTDSRKIFLLAFVAYETLKTNKQSLCILNCASGTIESLTPSVLVGLSTTMLFNGTMC